MSLRIIEYADRPEGDWHVLDVMRKERRKWDWVALLVDFDPDDLKSCGNARECWLRVPGKHRNRDAAWDTLEELMATRH